MRAVIPNASLGQILAIATLIFAAACPAPLPAYPYPNEPDPRKAEVVLGVGDVVAVNVWENGNLNTEATIRPDGTITMPLIGDLRAAGETTTTLKAQIKAQLQNYLKQLQGSEITVALKGWHSYKFTIQGEVGKTGVFTSDQYVRISDALALAGGPSRFAKRNEITLTRVDPKTGQQRRIPFDYDLLLSGKRPDMNIFVLAGDEITVP